MLVTNVDRTIYNDDMPTSLSMSISIDGRIHEFSIVLLAGVLPPRRKRHLPDESGGHGVKRRRKSILKTIVSNARANGFPEKSVQWGQATKREEIRIVFSDEEVPFNDQDSAKDGDAVQDGSMGWRASETPATAPSQDREPQLSGLRRILPR